MRPTPLRATLFPYTTLFRSEILQTLVQAGHLMSVDDEYRLQTPESASWDAEFKKNYTRIVNDDARIASERAEDRKSTRLNSSHTVISYAVFCLKKKTKRNVK